MFVEFAGVALPPLVPVPSPRVVRRSNNHLWKLLLLESGVRTTRFLILCGLLYCDVVIHESIRPYWYEDPQCLATRAFMADTCRTNLPEKEWLKRTVPKTNAEMRCPLHLESVCLGCVDSQLLSSGNSL
jgi:hypothetical protein